MAANVTKEKLLFCRAEPQLVREAQEIADREYEGVLSRVVRVAVRQFVQEKSKDIETSDLETSVAA